MVKKVNDAQLPTAHHLALMVIVVRLVLTTLQTKENVQAFKKAIDEDLADTYNRGPNAITAQVHVSVDMIFEAIENRLAKS